VQIAETLRKQHQQAVEDLVSNDDRRLLLAAEIEKIIEQVTGLCYGTALLRELSPRVLDEILSTGERLSARLLSNALCELGLKGVAVEATELIVTDNISGRADPLMSQTREKAAARLLPLIADDSVPVVTGFIGATPEGTLTTLGRGGSDLTAIALAAALKAALCQIYTDVDGVYTADPRLVPSARKLGEISYDEMLELSSLGAKVMQSRSVEFAKKFGVVFEVRSSLNDNLGTLVKEETQSMESVVIRGVSLDKNQAKVTLAAVPDKPGVAARIFKAIGEAAINVDMIVQTASHGAGAPATDISFTIDKPDLLKAQKVLENIKSDIGYREVIADEKIGKLSIVGVGMRSHSGVAAKMFEALAEANVNIDMISTSEIKISVVIDAAKGDQAVKGVHEAFLS